MKDRVPKQDEVVLVHSVREPRTPQLGSKYQLSLLEPPASGMAGPSRLLCPASAGIAFTKGSASCVPSGSHILAKVTYPEGLLTITLQFSFMRPLHVTSVSNTTSGPRASVQSCGCRGYRKGYTEVTQHSSGHREIPGLGPHSQR